MKCDWSIISFIQVERNKTLPIFQKLYHTNICTSSLYEFAIVKLVESHKLYHTNCLM